MLVPVTVTSLYTSVYGDVTARATFENSWRTRKLKAATVRSSPVCEWFILNLFCIDNKDTNLSLRLQHFI